MAERVRVELISKGMKELLHDPGVRRELERRMARVLTTAKAAAPSKSGEFRKSLRLISTTTDRAVVRVGSDDRRARFIEAKNGTLARSLDSAGGT